MARTKSPSPKVSGPRKRNPSSKAKTNGDPLQAQKRRKALSNVNKGVTAALTRKKTKATAAARSKANPDTRVENEDDSTDDITMEDITSRPSQNPNIDPVADGTDNDSNPAAPDVDDSENEEASDLEAPEETAETELGERTILYLTELIIFQIERLSNEWVSPIYVFFRNEARVEYVNDRRLHVFVCAAQRCRGKNGRDVRRFLDTGDAKSTSGLRRHAKKCWGTDAVEAADGTQDLESARTVLAKTKFRDGSITTQFQRIAKGKATFSHRQHTTTEAR